MNGTSAIRNRMLIALITLGGTALVFVSMAVMNQASHEPEVTGIGTIVSFEVPTPTRPPEPQRQEERRRQTPSADEPVLAPLPNLGANLSGIAVSLPDFEAAGVSGVSESLLGDLDNVALTEDAVDDPPSPRARVVPEYPERARQREIEGSVLVSVLVGTDGQVKNAKILESIPPGIFDAAVDAAVRQWTFEPAQYRGTAVETWVNIPFPFRLN